MTQKPSSFSPQIAYVWDRLLPTDATDAEQALNTMSALSKNGAKITAVIPTPESDYKDVQKIKSFYQVDGDFETSFIDNPFANYLVLRKFYHALKLPLHPLLSQADFVYTRNLLLFLRCVEKGYRTIYDTHRAWPKQYPFLTPLIKRAMKKPNFVGAMFHSSYSRDVYVKLGIDPRKLHTLRNGFDPKRFQPVLSKEEARKDLGITQERPMIAYTGHVTAFKGTQMLLEIARQTPEADFWLVGSKGEGITEKKAAKIPNVHIVPWKPYDEVVKYLYAADILILPPSDVPLKVAGHTVLPMKVYSYLATEKPIVAPSTPDLLEVLEDQKNALLVDPGRVDQAKDAIENILSNPTLSQKLSKGARNTSKDLTWDTRAKKILSILQREM